MKKLLLVGLLAFCAVVKAALTENLESYCGRRDVLAVAKSLYNMGITMGTYFI